MNPKWWKLHERYRKITLVIIRVLTVDVLGWLLVFTLALACELAISTTIHAAKEQGTLVRTAMVCIFTVPIEFSLAGIRPGRFASSFPSALLFGFGIYSTYLAA